MGRRHRRASAGLERSPRIIVAGGFHAIDGRRRRERLHGGGHARKQSAAAARRNGDVQLGAARAGLAHQLQPRRALAGHDVRVIEGRNQDRAAFGGNGCGDFLAALGQAIVQLHLGAVAPGIGDLHGRGVGRHDDQRRHAEQAGRQRHALGVVAAGEGHDPAGALGGVELNQSVVGAAELEGAHPLQGFGLDQNADAQTLIQGVALQQRSLHRMARQALGRGLDVGEADGEGAAHLANTMASSAKALNSSALPLGSRKNMVDCSPGSPLKRV